MKSRWFHLKEKAIALREQGTSMTVIERQFGIPRSTLSGWFRDVKITEEQRVRLMENRRDGWKKAREKSLEARRTQKTYKLLVAKNAAMETLDKIEFTNEVLELAFAMLYLGEGAKSGATSLSSSDPKILKFMLAVLRRNYGITPGMVRCDLHLRMDQDEASMKLYWSEQLNIPLERFTYTAFDKRSAGKPTYKHYKGVCVIACGDIAIQRKLIYLYNLFCERVTAMDVGA